MRGAALCVRAASSGSGVSGCYEPKWPAPGGGRVRLQKRTGANRNQAVACALALDKYAQDFRDRWREKGIARGATRIGAHAGPAIVGNFGGGRFFDYTAYGDTINVAARLETANKQLGTRICISAQLAARVFCGRPVGDLMLRGRTEAFALSSRCRASSTTIRQRVATWMRLRNSKRAIRRHSPHLRRVSASGRMISSRAFT